MIMERTAVGGQVTSYSPSFGVISTGSLARFSQAGSSTRMDVRELDRRLDQVFEVLAVLRAEHEVPEVFNLEPVERQRVTLHVRSVRPAEFYFVDDGIEDVDL